jgi:hypothetical protein
MMSIAVAGSPVRIVASGSTEDRLTHPTAHAWQLDAGGHVLHDTAFGRTDDNSTSEALGAAIDPRGNVLVAGYFGGKLALPSSPRATSTADGFVAHVDGNGVVTSFDPLAGPGLKTICSFAFAPEGWVALGGFERQLRVGSNELRAGGDDVFLLKGGAAPSLRRPAGLSPGTRFPHAANVDAGGNMAIAAVIDAPSLTVEIASIDAGGKRRWSRRLSGVGVHFESLLADASGDLVACGSFSTTLELADPAPRSAGDTDVFVARLDAKGGTRWLATFGSPAKDTVSTCALDASGNVYAGGDFSGAIDFGAGVLTPEGEDGFVISLDSAGHLRWARRVGGPGVDAIRGVAVAGADAVYVTGVFTGPLSLRDAAITPAGPRDGFVARLTPQ